LPETPRASSRNGALRVIKKSEILSGHGPNGGGTEAYPTRDDVTKAVMSRPQPEMTARLCAVRDYGIKLPSASGKSATVGFCFGGS
jgi:carboxymethylenebutenolidase